MMERLRVAHIITDLDTGGSELVLARLLGGMDRMRFEQMVISLKPAGAVADQIQKHGIPVASPGFNPGFPNPVAVYKLVKLIRHFKPDAIQTWMYHADLAGGLAARLAGRFPVVWGIRNNYLIPGASKARTVWIVRLLARLSNWVPARIVSCSETARLVHIGLGYRAEKFLVIPNGFDLERFHPDVSARCQVREELNLAPDTELVGLVARFDPNKDHQNFVRAAGILLERRPGVHFLLCGEGITPENPSLAVWIGETGEGEHFHLLGRRDDIPRLTAGLDIASSASFSEAFPNVIGEAMACGVPVGATDAGDSAAILGSTGQVVPRRDPPALATAWLKIFEMSPKERQVLSWAVRQRMVEQYSLEGMVSHYQKLYESISRCSA
jgi:glycosyltransferase involved in cell wall biosynthesis